MVEIRSRFASWLWTWQAGLPIRLVDCRVGIWARRVLMRALRMEAGRSR